MTAIPLPEPKRTYGWRSWRDPLIELVLAIAVGWTVTLVQGAGRNQVPSSHSFVRNAILAVSILILARGLETMLSWAIEQSRIALAQLDRPSGSPVAAAGSLPAKPGSACLSLT